jgi:hypothetical protein
MMVATESKTDIYELLGISQDASTALAREMYWSKISEYLEAERQGEPGARQAIDALNEALNIVLDASLRREYDSALAETSPRPKVDALAPSTSRVWSVLVGMQLITVVAAVAVGIFASPLTGIGVAFIGTSTTIGAWIGFRRLRPLAGSPFALLGLDGSASLDEVELAYESRVQELLVRVHHDPSVVSRLELVDRAYGRACALIALGEAAGHRTAPGAEPRRRGAIARGQSWVVDRTASGIKWALFSVLRGLLWLASLAVAGTQRLIDGMAEWVRQRATSTPRPVLPDPEDYDPPAAPRARAQVRRHILDSPEDDDEDYEDDEDDEDELAAPAPQVDVNRRLAAGFKSAAERIAEHDARASTAEAEPTVESGKPIDSYIVLGSVAGARRVGIGDTPIKIGSAEGCDLVLPEDSGVAPEHALIWRHQDAIVLHVTDHSAACLVNDRPMTWATLESGDEVRMGTFKMRIEVDAADSE